MNYDILVAFIAIIFAGIALKDARDAHVEIEKLSATMLHNISCCQDQISDLEGNVCTLEKSNETFARKIEENIPLMFYMPTHLPHTKRDVRGWYEKK